MILAQLYAPWHASRIRPCVGIFLCLASGRVQRAASRNTSDTFGGKPPLETGLSSKSMVMQIQHVMDDRSELITLAQRVQRGVSLIEMLIGLMVLSSLLALAAPSFALWMQNA